MSPASSASSAAAALGPAVLALYYLILAVLAFFGVHRLWMVLLYLKTRRRTPVRPPDPELWPLVTVQLVQRLQIVLLGPGECASSF